MSALWSPGSHRATSDRAESRAARWWWLLWGLVSGVLAVGFAVAKSPSALWDFRGYYLSLRVFLAGGDPYAALPAVLADPSLTELTTGAQPFIYPPSGVLLLAPLALVEYQTAAVVFQALKVVAIVILGAFTLQWRPVSMHPVAWIACLVCAFGGSLLYDLRAGNIALFEAAALAGLVEATRRGRPYVASMLGSLAGSVKLYPLALVGSLLALGRPEPGVRRPGPLILGGAMLVLPWVVRPDLTQSFWRQLPGIVGGSHRGAVDASALSMLRDLVTLISGEGKQVGFALYLIASIAVAALTVRALAPSRSADHTTRVRFGVPLLYCAFALVAPRTLFYAPVLYSWALVHVLLGPGSRLRRAVGLVALLLPMRYLLRLFPGYTEGAVDPGWTWIAAEYWTLWVALFAWVVALRRPRSVTLPPPTPSSH